MYVRNGRGSGLEGSKTVYHQHRRNDSVHMTERDWDKDGIIFADQTEEVKGKTEGKFRWSHMEHCESVEPGRFGKKFPALPCAWG